MAELTALAMATPEEQEAALLVLAAVFVPHAKPERVAWRWRRMIREDAGFLAVLGAQLDGQGVGAAVLLRRRVRIGAATVDLALLRSLAVLPDARRQGVGTALCELAASTAREAGLPVLAVKARPGFFGGRGFTKVYDPHQLAIDLHQARTTRPRPDRLRPMGLGDVELVQALYEEHFAPYLGAPARDLAGMRERLARRLPDQAPMLAVDESGQVRGYLIASQGGWPPAPEEVLALDAEAARDLLAYHTQFAARFQGPEQLYWVLPPGAPTLAAAAQVASCREETDDAPDSGPMALVTDAPALLAALEPELARRSDLPRPDFATLNGAQLAELTFAHRRPAELGLEGEAWAAYWPQAPVWVPDLAM